MVAPVGTGQRALSCLLGGPDLRAVTEADKGLVGSCPEGAWAVNLDTNE